MGIEIDRQANAAAQGEVSIHTAASRTQLWVVPTNEEIVVARQSAESKGQVFDAEGFQGIKELVEAQIEEQSLPYFLSGLGYDDGVIDPRDTRTVLGICLSVIHTQPVQGEMNFGVFRL